MTTDAPACGRTPLRRLVVAMLLTAAPLDLARTGIGVHSLAHRTTEPVFLIVAGVGAAAVALAVADGCRAGHRWAYWAALTVGIASAPQAAAYGFTGSYTGVDLATAVVGIALTITLLTAGPARRPQPSGRTRAPGSPGTVTSSDAVLIGRPPGGQYGRCRSPPWPNSNSSRARILRSWAAESSTTRPDTAT
jgi:hypothetical protein